MIRVKTLASHLTAYDRSDDDVADDELLSELLLEKLSRVLVNLHLDRLCPWPTIPAAHSKAQHLQIRACALEPVTGQK